MSNSKKLKQLVKGDLPQSVIEDMIRQRAYEIYEARGREDGRDFEHWAEAEAEVREEFAQESAA